MQGVLILRNELGGHGQGQSVVSPPRPYGELAVYLAGAVNHFLIEQFLRKHPPPPPPPKSPPVQMDIAFARDEMDDEIPF